MKWPHQLLLGLVFSSLVSSSLADDGAKKKSHPALPRHAHNKRDNPAGHSRVSWQSGDNTGVHASSPRSAKYWREHGLDKNKPDYAKTDGEVFRERWGFDSPGTYLSGKQGAFLRTVVLVIAFLVGVGVLFQASWTDAGRGQMLGGGGGDVAVTAEQREQQRRARLEKFEAVARADTGGVKPKQRGAYAAAMAQSMGVIAD